MAKISYLDLVAEPDGNETVVVLKDGVARRVPLGAVAAAALDPQIAAALAQIEAVIALHVPPSDPAGPGYNIWAVAGQSNGVGYGLTFNPALDTANPRIRQFLLYSGTAYNGSMAGQVLTAGQIVPAIDPLYHTGFNNPNPALNRTNKIGAWMTFARGTLPLLAADRGMLAIPASSGGSPMELWTPEACKARLPIQAVNGGTPGHSVTIGGHTITLAASGAAGQQINCAADAAGLMANFKAYADANAASLSWKAIHIDGSDVELEANAAGAAGNSLTATRNGASFLLGNADNSNFNGGSDGTGYLLQNLINGINAAKALDPNHRVEGVLWWHGEASSKMSAYTRTPRLEAMIAKIKADTNTPDLKFIAFGMVREWLNEGKVGEMRFCVQHDKAHRDLPLRIANTAFVACPPGNQNAALGEDIVHHDAALHRIMGARAVLAAIHARGNVVGAVPAPLRNAEAVRGSMLGTIDVSYDLPLIGNTRVTAIRLRYRTGTGPWTEIVLEHWRRAVTLTPPLLATDYEVQVRGENESGAGEWVAAPLVSTHPVPYILDEIVGLKEVVSVATGARKMTADYDGPCWRVRRDSDNAEQDFGFDANGLFDIASALDWCDGASGFVAVEYDHRGNGHHSVQATHVRQPRIINAGVPVTDAAGRPAIEHFANGANPMFTGSTTGFPGGGDMTEIAVVDLDAVAGSMWVIGPKTGNAGMLLNPQPAIFVGAQLAKDSGAFLPGKHSIGVTYGHNGTNWRGRVFRAGVQRAEATSATATTGTGFHLGCYQEAPTLRYFGRRQEQMILTVAQPPAKMAEIAAFQRFVWGAG